MPSILESAENKDPHAEPCGRLTALSFIAVAGDCNRNTQGENVHQSRGWEDILGEALFEDSLQEGCASKQMPLWE